MHSPSIEERLGRLEDEREILRTLHTYGHSIDYGDEAAFVDCFLPDGVLHWPNRGPMTGSEEIRTAFRQHSHAPEFYHKHLLIEPLISLSGDYATVQSMFARLDTYDAVPEIFVYGRYRDDLARCADGRWRFRSRYADVEAWHPGPLPAQRVTVVGGQ